MESVCWLLLGSIALTVHSVQGQCGRPPGNPNTVLTETDILKPTFNDGETATFKCTVGYTAKGGSTKVTCNAGTWTPLFLQCEKKSCGSPGEVMHGYFDLSEGIEFGATVQAICDVGYGLFGNGQKRCEAAGWAGIDPVCEVKKCQPPPPVANADPAVPNKDIYEYGDAVLFKCNTGFTLDGSSSITCSADETFSPAPPTCIMVLCPTPEINNAKRVGGGRPPYGFQNHVTYGCEPGYTLEGANTLTCRINNTWSNPFPVCKETPTTTTKAPSTTVKPSTPSATVPVSGRVPGPVDPTEKPSPEGFNGWYIGGPALGLSAVGVIVFFVYRKKKSANRSHPLQKDSKKATEGILSH